MEIEFQLDYAKEIEDLRKQLDEAYPERELPLRLEKDADEIIRFGYAVMPQALWNIIAALVWADIYPEPLPDDIYPNWTVWKLHWSKNSMKSFYEAIADRLETYLPEAIGMHMSQLYEDISRGSMSVASKIVRKLATKYSLRIEHGDRARSCVLRIMSPCNMESGVGYCQHNFLIYQLITRIYSLCDTMLSGLLKTVIPELRKKNIHKGKEKE